MPSNMVGAQRARLLVNHFEELGWCPIVLSIHPDCYEEPIVPELVKLVKPEIEVHFVKAPTKGRKYKWIGDLTLRAYHQIKTRAIEIINTEKVDFVWLPIPSFYNALLGRPIHKATGVPYGIDYIDPWVNGFTGQGKLFSKAWIANQLAKILEPYAVKRASLISGVAYHYYSPVLERNFKHKAIEHCAMQYGFDENDYLVKADPFDCPWDKNSTKAIIYAGAFLPKSHYFINLLFKVISQLRQDGKLDDQIKLYFFGTGPYKEKSITEYAIEHGIDDLVFEHRERLSYLQILNLLRDAYAVMVIGSTEKHYTASKVFQSLLSKTPVFTIFHELSDAATILKIVQADTYTALYTENEDELTLYNKILTTFDSFANRSKHWHPELTKLQPYSAKESARILIEEIEKVLKNKE